MAYTHTSLSAAHTLLAVRLADPFRVRFTAAELTVYLTEALRTWSALTGIWEVESAPVLFPAGTTFIDLSSSFPAERNRTVTDLSMVNAMQYALLEPVSVAGVPGAEIIWSGTEMFTMAELVNAIQHRRDQFLAETRIHLTRTTAPTAAPGPGPVDPLLVVIAAGTESYSLESNIIDPVRIAWSDVATGRTTRMWESSAHALRATSRDWSQGLSRAYVPKTFVRSERLSNAIDFGPPPMSNGRLDIIASQIGETIDPSFGMTRILEVPDDFTWAVKWGALADLLTKDGPGRDYARALFCERHYRIGVAAALTSPNITNARISGRQLQFTTIDALDTAIPDWQSRTTKNANTHPATLATVGHNMVALALPNAGPIQLQLTMRKNAPVPVAGGDYLQIGKEHLELILGYAAHLAMFKVGGTEFAATTQLARALFEAATDYNEALKEHSAYSEFTYGRAEEKVAVRGVRRVTGGTMTEAPEGAS